MNLPTKVHVHVNTSPATCQPYRVPGGSSSGGFFLEGDGGGFMSGRIDKGTLTPSGNFNLRGSVTSDNLCQPAGLPTPYNMHISGECGENVDIKFRTEDGEQANFSGDVRCTSTN